MTTTFEHRYARDQDVWIAVPMTGADYSPAQFRRPVERFEARLAVIDEVMYSKRGVNYCCRIPMSYGLTLFRNESEIYPSRDEAKKLAEHLTVQLKSSLEEEKISRM